MTDGRVVVDARWLGHTGIGRVTEMLLSGLSLLQPGPWTIWGPPTASEYVWPGASFAQVETSPLQAAAQASARRVPPGILLTPHAVRPLLPRRLSLVVLNDLIPIRFANTAAQRLAWRCFFVASVRMATLVAVYSTATMNRLAEIAPGVHPRMIRLTPPPPPPRASDSTGAGPSSRSLLFVGQLKQHKNLSRAIEGFSRSTFAREGGRFAVLGAAGDASEVRRMANTCAVTNLVDIFPRRSEQELEALYASATAVIQPSLEEGLGLPAVEALLRGVPVACSDIDAHREATGGIAVTFDPLDPISISDAIDTAAAMAGTEAWRRRAETWRREHPPMTPAQFAAQFLPLLEDVAAGGIR